MSGGLKTDDFYYLKCWVVLVKVGKKVLIKILEWGHQNPDNRSLRESLSLLPGYSNTRYNRDFNKDERKKIEIGTVDDFDITLLYTLIQRLCKLVPGDEQININNSCVKEISKLLLDVKTTRNKFAHPLLGLKESDMISYIGEMKEMFIKLLEVATHEFSLDQQMISSVKMAVVKDLQEIVDSPLPASSKKQIAIEKTALAIEEGKKDLINSYQHMEDISISPWPYPPHMNKLQNVFFRGRIKFPSATAAQCRLTEDEAVFHVGDILSKMSAAENNFILVTGKSGSGKSTYFKYITYSWLFNWDNSVTNIEGYDFVIYLDCRDLSNASLKEVLGNLMPNAALLFSEEELKSVILTTNCLFLLDNLDELQSSYMNLITEILSSYKCQVIASATNDISNQVSLKVQSRKTSNFILETLGRENVQQFIERLASFMRERSEYKKVEIFYSDVLKHFDSSCGWIQNPEIISHMFFNWYFSGGKYPRCSSLTHVLLNSFNMILKKLKDRLAKHSLFDVVEAHTISLKLQSFLLELGRIASCTINDETSGLGFKGTSQLILKCQQLDLPANIILSEFLCFRETLDEGKCSKSMEVTFPSKMFHEFCSAYHIYYVLISQEHHAVTVNEILRNVFSKQNSEEDTIIPNIKNIIRYLVGLLSISHENVLSDYASQILEVLVQKCNMKPSDWFSILEEIHGNSKTIKLLILKYLEANWKLEDDMISLSLSKILAAHPPDTIQISCMKDPKLLYHLEETLKCCATSSKRMTLSLLIYSQFWKSDVGYSTDLLKIVNLQNSSCLLLNFAGRLKSEDFRLLPETLKRLALQIDAENIPSLNDIIQRLKLLDLLSLSLTIPGSSNQRQIQPLFLKPDLMISIDVFGCQSDNITETASTIRKLSPSFVRVSIRKSNLTFVLCRELISKLNEEGLTITSIVTGSSVSLQAHELINIKTLAANMLGCKSFKWITI